MQFCFWACLGNLAVPWLITCELRESPHHHRHACASPSYPFCLCLFSLCRLSSVWLLHHPAASKEQTAGKATRENDAPVTSCCSCPCLSSPSCASWAEDHPESRLSFGLSGEKLQTTVSLLKPGHEQVIPQQERSPARSGNTAGQNDLHMQVAGVRTS